MKKDEKPEFISDTTNLANENKKINTVFAKFFANSIVSIFTGVYNWLEVNRLLNSNDPVKEIKTIANDEEEPHKFSKMKFFN